VVWSFLVQIPDAKLIKLVNILAKRKKKQRIVTLCRPSEGSKW